MYTHTYIEIHTMEYYSATHTHTHTNAIFLFVTTWIGIQGIMLNEIS